MWVTKLLISPVKKQDFCPKTTKFSPKLACLSNAGPKNNANKVPRWVFCYVGNKTFDFCQEKLGFFAQNWHFCSFWARPCQLIWWVGWWLWHAGCISQDTYLLYTNCCSGSLFANGCYERLVCRVGKLLFWIFFSSKLLSQTYVFQIVVVDIFFFKSGKLQGVPEKKFPQKFNYNWTKISTD